MVTNAINRQNQFITNRIEQIFRLIDPVRNSMHADRLIIFSYQEDKKFMPTNFLLEALMFDGRDWAAIFREMKIGREGTVTRSDFTKVMMQALFSLPTSKIASS